jgi:hypothetical protein
MAAGAFPGGDHGNRAMKFPSWIKPGAWGVALGAVLTVGLGFYQFGWTSAATTERIARDESRAAVVAALVPFCVAKAEGDTDPARLTAMRAATSSYSRGDLVGAAGWATMPGMASPDTDLARACSERLVAAAG